MSAKFDINLKLKRRITYSEVVDIIRSECHEVDISEVWVIDNWLYENEEEIKIISDKEIDKLLDKGKIIISYIILDKSIMGGFCLVYQNGHAIINLWIDTKTCEYLDCGFIDKSNEKVYKQIISWVLHMESKLSIEVCAIGSETDFVYERSIRESVEKSMNIVCWVLFNNTAVLEIPNYNVRKINQNYVFWKTFEAKILKLKE